MNRNNVNMKLEKSGVLFKGLGETKIKGYIWVWMKILWKRAASLIASRKVKQLPKMITL